MFCYVRLLTGYPRSKTRAPECFEQTFKGGLSLRAKSGSAPGIAVAQSVVRSRHHWWSWSPSVWNTPVDLWTFEKGTNKQTNKQTNHLSLKSLSISPFFNPNSLKTILMASFTNIVHRRLCCRPATISPTLVSGQAKGMEELLPMAYTRSTLQTSSAPNDSTVLSSDLSYLFFEMRCYFPNEMRGKLNKSTDFNRWNIPSDDRWFIPTHFASILWIPRGFDMYPGSKV